MRTSRNIYAPNLNLEHLAQALTAWYRTEHYNIERSNSSNGSVCLKCRHSSSNGEAKPSVLVTLYQQNPALTVDVEVVKNNKSLLITALVIAAIVGLFSLFAGSCGFLIFLLAIGFCIFCTFSLMRNSNMPAKTFTVIEQFIAAPQSISPPFSGTLPHSGASMLPPMQQIGQHGPIGGNRWTGNSPGQRSGRDEPIGSPVRDMGDKGWDVGALSAKPTRHSARDEPIDAPEPASISSDNAFVADEIVPSGFSRQGAAGTAVPKAGVGTRVCSCGETNPPEVKFCEGCGKPLAGQI